MGPSSPSATVRTQIPVGGPQQQESTITLLVELVKDALVVLGMPPPTFASLIAKLRVERADTTDACSLIEMFECSASELTRKMRHQSEKSLTEQVKRMVQENYSDKLTGSILALRVGAPYQTVNREFRKETGHTVHEFLIEIRMHKAFDLISHGAKVEAAMFLSGFHSKRNFYRQFRRRYGRCPSAARRGN